MQNKLSITLGAMIGITSGLAHSATCSCAGVPLLNSMETTSADAGKFYINASFERHYMNDLYAGTSKVHDDTNRRRMTDSFILQGDYGINENWSLTGLISHVKHQREIGTSIDSFNEARGIGDSIFMLKYTPQKINLLSRWEYAFGVGAKLASGSDDKSFEGVVLSQDMQPSSGANGIVGWAYVGKSLDQPGQKHVFASVNYSVNGDNKNGYQFGDELNISIGGSYTFAEKWGVSAQIRHRTTERDKRGDALIPNTGGNWLELVPSVQYRFNDKSAISIGARIPLHRDLDGALQFTTSSAVSITYSHQF